MKWTEFIECCVVEEVKDLTGAGPGRYTAACPPCGVDLAIMDTGVPGFASPLACIKAVADLCRSRHGWVIDEDEITWQIRQPI